MIFDSLSKSRRNLLLLLVTFVIPVVLAKLALDNQWFNEAATNKGVLLEESLSLSDIEVNDEELQKKWLILYPLPEVCDQACVHVLYGINQTYISLGREIERTLPVGLYSSILDVGSVKGQMQKAWHFSKAPSHAKKQLDPSKVYVVDPLGNIILKYHAPNTHQGALDLGKALLSDLRKLLKYSRIG